MLELDRLNFVGILVDKTVVSVERLLIDLITRTLIILLQYVVGMTI